MKLPIEISPNPLVSSTIEIRFGTNNLIKREDVVSVFYPHFSLMFPKVAETKTAAAQAGQVQTHPLFFTFSNDDYAVSFGSNVVSFDNIGTYHLWSNYFNKIKEVLLILLELKIINSIERIGLRYVSVFENRNSIKGVFDLNIKIDADSSDESVKFFQTEIVKDKNKIFLQVSENVNFFKNNKIHNGVYIDIDVSRLFEPKTDFDEKLFDLIEEAHSSEKVFFYSLLNKDFLLTLNPIY